MKLFLALFVVLLTGCPVRVCSLTGCQADDAVRDRMPAPVSWPDCDGTYQEPSNGKCKEKNGGLFD